MLQNIKYLLGSAFPFMPWRRLQHLQREAESYVRIGSLDLAEKTYRIISHQYKHSPTGPLGVASIAFKKHNHAKALSQLRNIFRDFPESSQVQARLGNTLMAMGDYNEAEDIFNKIDPHSPARLIGQATIAVRKNDLIRALPLWREAAEKYPDNLKTKKEYAAALASSGNFSAAGDIYQQLTRKRPTSTCGYIGLARISISQHHYHQSLDILRDAVSRFPDNHYIKLMVARSLVLLDRREDALAIQLTIIKKHPNYITGLIDLCHNLINLDQFEKAEHYIQQAMASYPDHPRLHLLRARNLIHTSADSSQACGQLAVALDKFPTNARVHFRRLILQDASNSEVLNDVSRVTLESSDLHCKIDLALPLAHLGRKEQAESILLANQDTRYPLKIQDKVYCSMALISAFYDRDIDTARNILGNISNYYRSRNNIVFPENHYQPQDNRAANLKSQRLLVATHIYYPTLLDEILDKIACIPSGTFDPWFSISVEIINPETLRERILSVLPEARFVTTENRGFDIGGYWNIFKQIRLEDYDLVLLLHTKKGQRFPDRGRKWRQNLLHSLINDKQTIQENINLMRSDQSISWMSSLYILPLLWHMGHNYIRHQEILDALSLDFNRSSQIFSAGTICLYRADYLSTIFNKLRDIEFEDYHELSFFRKQLDQSYAHAIEAALGSFAAYHGGKISYLENPARLIMSGAKISS